MNKNRVYMMIFTAALLAVIIYVSNGMLNAGKKEEYYAVSVILDDSSNERWSAFKEGLEQGAEEYYIHLNLVSTGELLSMEEETTLLEREVESGADGLIAQLCQNPTESFEGIAESKPLILVENPVQSEKMYTMVTPDYEKLGEALAEAVLEGEDAATVLSGQKETAGQQKKTETELLRIGVLAGAEEKASQLQCLKGLERGFKDRPVLVEWVLYEEEISRNSDLREWLETKPVDVLVTLDNEETERAVDFLLEYPETEICLYGEGRSEKAVYYLDKGLIKALAVPNEFYMGYRSVELLAQKLGYHVTNVQQEEVEYLLVTRETLYEKNVEKVLFPTVR